MVLSRAVLFASLVAVGSAATAARAQQPAVARTKAAVVVDRCGEGFLEVEDGRKILHTKGTSYERGFQYGYLVGDEIEAVFDSLDAFAKKEIGRLGPAARRLLTPLGASFYRNYFDPDALQEIEGIVDGAREKDRRSKLRRRHLVFVNALIDLGATVEARVFKCSSLAVWGDVTRDGKLYQTRNVDLMTGTGLEDHVLVVMAKPEGGVPYCNAGWAGLIGCASGLNAHGVGVGQVWASSHDVQFGRPWPLAARELLGTKASVDEAEWILRSDRRTYGSNFVFADRGDLRGGLPRAIAVESTANHLAVFEADDPREDQALYDGECYAIRKPFAVFRGDTAMDPTIRSLQKDADKDPRKHSGYSVRYKGQADRIQAFVDRGTKIGRDECLQISRQVADRDDSLQCCVYENTDLELWVANARIDADGQVHDACDEPFHSYSLDYYTPTARVVPGAREVEAGASLEVWAWLETLGSARALDLRLRLEQDGAVTRFSAGGQASVSLDARGQLTASLSVTLPAGLEKGGADLILEVYEAGTDDLVDVTIEELTVKLPRTQRWPWRGWRWP